MKRWIIAFALLAAACGGGGGGDGSPSPPPSSGPASLGLLAGVAPGGRGSVDGPADIARFNRPSGITTDSAGSIYVSDAGNYTIRKIGTNGIVSTLAGAPTQPGSRNGAGAEARFGGDILGTIGGIVVDAAGNAYVADAGSNTIRMIAPNGTVTAFAGSLTAGSGDGPAMAATFLRPYGLAIDAAGNIYVGDSGNVTLRKIARGGMVSTVAGAAGQTGFTDGIGAAARFSSVGPIAVDSGGNVFVSDTGNSVIRKVTPGGLVTTFAGRPGIRGRDDGPASMATFYNPTGIAVDRADNIYVADSTTLRKVTPAGVVTTIVAGTEANLGLSLGLAVDGSGNVLIADSEANVVRRATPTGTLTTIAGASAAAQAGYLDGVGGEARFTGAADVEVDAAGNVVILEADRIRRATPAGVVTTWVSAGESLRFDPWIGLGLDEAGNAYVAYSNRCGLRPQGCVPRGEIYRIDASARPSRLVVTSSSDGSGTDIGAIVAIAADRAGNVFIAEPTGNRIRKLNSIGDIVVFVPDVNGVQAMTVDGTGALYVALLGNDGHAVRKVDPAGNVTTIIDVPGTPSGTAAPLSFPRGVAVDPSGNVYISDAARHVVLKVTATGSISTIAGTANVAGFSGGALPGFLDAPLGIAIRGRELYIAMDTAVAVVHNTP